MIVYFYLFYKIKALSIVHPVDIIPNQSFSVITYKNNRLDQQSDQFSLVLRLVCLGKVLNV